MEKTISQFIEANTKVRYIKAKGTKLFAKVSECLGELGVSEETQERVLGGNSQDKNLIAGLIVNQMALKEGAKESILSELGEETKKAQEPDSE